MRVSRQAMDTEALPWEPVSDVMQRKVLNGDPASGPHTILLRSAPREPGPAFAQYHAVDEEFFALDGDFTFDGSTWFRGGSYAFYPAYFVHGASVHVRGGYEVYLRNSGLSELFIVDEPESHVPYYAGEGQAANQALQLVDVISAVDSAPDAGSPHTQPLHSDAATGAGSTIVSAAAGQAITVETVKLLEAFTLSGVFRLADDSRLTKGTYHCEVSDRPSLRIVCDEAGTLMISHGGELQHR